MPKTVALAMLAGLLASCGSTRVDEATKDDYLKYAWVVMGDGGKPACAA